MQLAQYNLYLTRSAAVMAGICLLSAILYGVFLLLAVQHTASRTRAERQSANLSAELGTMEMQYLAATKSFTPARAAELGFVKPATHSTVFASGPAKALSLKGRE